MNTTKYQNELSELMVIYITSSNQTISEMFIISLRIKKSIILTFNEIKNSTSTCWNEKYQFLTIDMTKDKYTGRYRLRLDSLFVPDTKPF